MFGDITSDIIAKCIEECQKRETQTKLKKYIAEPFVNVLNEQLEPYIYGIYFIFLMMLAVLIIILVLIVKIYYRKL